MKYYNEDQTFTHCEDLAFNKWGMAIIIGMMLLSVVGIMTILSLIF